MRAGMMAMIAAMAMGAGAQADPVDGKAAKKMLFSTRNVDLQILDDSGLEP